MKKCLVIIGVIVLIILGILIGFIINNKGKISQTVTDNSYEDDVTNEETLRIYETEEVSAEEEKTTPNTLIMYKTYYTKCNHYINEYADIDITSVNMTEKEIKDKNEGWNIQEFSAKQVVFEKEEDEFCNQHFRIKLVNGFITIFNIDEKGIETEYENTQITEEYLTDEDILKLKEGIIVYGKEELIQLLEDYE